MNKTPAQIRIEIRELNNELNKAMNEPPGLFVRKKPERWMRIRDLKRRIKALQAKLG